MWWLLGFKTWLCLLQTIKISVLFMFDICEEKKKKTKQKTHLILCNLLVVLLTLLWLEIKCITIISLMQNFSKQLFYGIQIFNKMG